MAEQEFTVQELDLDEEIEVACIWFGNRQVVFTLLSLRKQMEKGADRDLLNNQWTGAGGVARNNVYVSQAEYFDSVAICARGIKGLDTSVDGWQKRVPYFFKSRVGAVMANVIDIPKPILSESEGND